MFVKLTKTRNYILCAVEKFNSGPGVNVFFAWEVHLLAPVVLLFWEYVSCVFYMGDSGYLSSEIFKY